MELPAFFRRKPAYTIVRLTAADAEDCAAIHAQGFPHGWDASEIANLILSENVVADGARAASGELLAFILSRKAADEAEILTIATSDAYRSQGIARELLARHLGNLARSGVAELFLEVEEGNKPARALYNRFGFQETGRREGYYRMADGSRAAALVMRRAVP